MAENYWDTISNAASNWLGISTSRSTATQPIVAESSKETLERIDPYSEITNANSSVKLKDTIGGSDISVFLLIEYPSVDPEELTVPLYLRKKEFVMLELDNAMSISYSIMREKFPVRNLGHINPSNIIGGSRTISGSLAFAIFTDDILTYIRSMISDRLTNISQKFKNYYKQITDKINNYDFVNTENPTSLTYRDVIDDAATKEQEWNKYREYYNAFNTMATKVQLLDALPPFHLLVMGVNEAGTFSKLLLKNVSIIDENQYHGTQQPHIMNKVTYVATDIVPMAKFKNNRTVTASMNSVDEQFIYGKTQKYNYTSEVIGSDMLDSLDDSLNKDTETVMG